MKVLWISHDPVRLSIKTGLSASGFWKEALLNLLVNSSDITIRIASPGKGRRVFENYTFRFPKKKMYHTLPKNTVKDLFWIIRDYKPDLIHVHGTEKPYGLIKKYTDIPVVISLQGFLNECYNSVLGEIPLPLWKKARTLKEFMLMNSFVDIHEQWFQNSKVEKEIVEINKYFIGRTSFDRNFVLKNNSSAWYFNGNELLRDEFYQMEWDIANINRHTIYTSSFSNPLKGFHVLLKATNYLKEEFPDLKIIVPGKLTQWMTHKYLGNSYYRIIKKMIDNYTLKDKITFAGKLDGKQISQIIKNTHIFVLSSFIENSSNALGEAQIIGVPCITSSSCGGIPSLIKNNQNGLFFNKGDSYDLSRKIKRLFLNDKFSIKISENAKIFGKNFHNKNKILEQYMDIYTTLINQ